MAQHDASQRVVLLPILPHQPCFFQISLALFDLFEGNSYISVYFFLLQKHLIELIFAIFFQETEVLLVSVTWA